MARFKLLIEYEGTRYSGWQKQKNARTVQGQIEEAIIHVFETRKFEFMGSGRTDAGVHALMQPAHLDVNTMLAPEIIRMKLNDDLPADINILEAEKAALDFHARHHALARVYLYQVSRRRTALGKKLVWWVKDSLDIALMKKTLEMFVGMKDFASFTDDDPEEKSTRVLIDRAEIKEDGALILIRITGSHFLWKMVRRVVGIVVEVGRGKMSVEQVGSFLSKASSEPARYTAPPSGLFLAHVAYSTNEPVPPLIPVLPVSLWRRGQQFP